MISSSLSRLRSPRFVIGPLVFVAGLLAGACGGGNSADAGYCDRARQAWSDFTKMDVTQSQSNPQLYVDEMKKMTGRLATDAPAGVRDDVGRMNAWVQTFASPDDVKKSEPPDVSQASDRVDRYLRESCGIDLTATP